MERQIFPRVTLRFIMGDERYNEACLALYDIVKHSEFGSNALADPKELLDKARFKYVNTPSYLVEYVLPIAQVAAPAISVVLVSWLQGRAGRKIRLKIGEIEVEAQTTEEVEHLLKNAQQLKSG